ncbi:hypothetical protein ACJEDT_02875 [Rhodococcoides fascians]|nr:hypothetical protein [Rhodococcus fascians]
MRISAKRRAFDVVGKRIESVEYESTDWGKPVTAIFHLGERVLTLDGHE